MLCEWWISVPEASAQIVAIGFALDIGHNPLLAHLAHWPNVAERLQSKQNKIFPLCTIVWSLRTAASP